MLIPWLLAVLTSHWLVGAVCHTNNGASCHMASTILPINMCTTMTKNKMIINSRKTGSAQNLTVSVTIRYTLVNQHGLDKSKKGEGGGGQYTHTGGKNLYERKWKT